MTSRIEPRILAGAIALFADYGYFGVTTRDLARKAKVTEGSIYRIFESKERLFDCALDAVVKRPLEPAKFLLMIFENRKRQDFCSAIAGPVRSWYFSFTHQSARLMVQAGLCRNERWRQIAYAPMERIIDILADSLDRELAKPNPRKANTKIIAQALFLALFQLKVVFYPMHSQEEDAHVEGIIAHWVNGLKGMM